MPTFTSPFDGSTVDPVYTPTVSLSPSANSFVSPFTGDVIQPTDVSYQAYVLTGDLQLQWPSNTSTLNNPVARIMDLSGIAASIAMPPANQASVGQDSLIRNNGANQIVVTDYAYQNVIVAINPGEAWYVYLTDNSTEAGAWEVLAFGAGSSQSDAGALAGLGLVALSAKLNQSHPSSQLSNGATLVASDRAQTRIWTTGSGTVALDFASTLGNNWFCLVKNNSTTSGSTTIGSLTIQTSGSNLIDLATSKTFAPNESAFIVCDGTQFITVGYGASSTPFVTTTLTRTITTGTYTTSVAQSSSSIQEFVGSLTGNVTVTFPTLSAIYVISNQVTANGFSLTIGTGIGLTVTVPSGNQMTVICDGINFYNANTVSYSGSSLISLANGSVGSPSLNFTSDTTTGLYRSNPGSIAFSTTGTQRLNISSVGIQVTGSGNFTTGLSGGTF